MNFSQSSSQTVSPIHRTVLNNGIVVLVKENPVADIVSARLFLRAGSRWEQPHQAGLSHLVSAVLIKGTTQSASLEIAERVESVGASLGTDSTPDYFLLSLKTVSADFAAILKLAGEVLRSPTFPAQELELERRLTLQAIRSQQEQPFTIAFDQLRQKMYGAHPYALSGLGTEATVAQLTQDDLFHYHRTHFRPDNLVVSLSGRIDLDRAVDLVTEVLGDWQAPPVPLPTLALSPISSQPATILTPQETQQAIVMLGYLAPAVHSTLAQESALPENAANDYAALKLLNSYLGNGLSSRLFVELREKRGLAYEVSAFYPTRLELAQFVVYMGTAPDNARIALAGLQAEVDRLSALLLAPEELQGAKNKLLGQYALGKQTNAQIAQAYGWYETLNLGIGFDAEFQQQITRLTAEQLRQAAQRHLAQPFVSMVGPASAIDLLTSAPA